ncbi:hypothetical protein GQX74_009140 [Glossina fuscipes]|nr:hypothetical protein GQX74_009140 [Glossina fuscipes]
MQHYSSGYLDVVVPPDILNHPDQNLEENVTNEGGIITLICSATGVPKPTVQWRRENLKDIVLRIESRERQAVLYTYVPVDVAMSMNVWSCTLNVLRIYNYTQICIK